MGNEEKAGAGSDPTLVANIVGQFCFAMGQGAGEVRVRRAAIEALRDRYTPYIVNATQGGVAKWQVEGIHVLEYMRAVGRTAAYYVTTDGRTKIEKDDFLRAAKVVESAAHHDRAPGRGLQGDWCP